jgi:hypothetical protein
MIQSLPYCRRCDLEINDGATGMYCVCTRRRLEAAAARETEARQAAMFAARAIEKRKAMAAWEARFDTDTRMMAVWTASNV